ncbi:phasin family protein [Halorhodospira halochloris]|uniref:phasin family protein n=1 Tax=Halorhodospira halochloris TaxID=1052 RepID=UPI001EE8330E|nr:phasin family protein [Halorhodospira halochloris]MCG5530595.1 phasin family protein [Halorhodospira halochloris]
MQDQINKSMQQMQKFMEPTRKMSNLMIDHAEKVAHLNLEAAREYSRLAMEQMRSAMNVRDPESMQEYLNSQNKVMQTVSSKLSEDATALADISKNMGEEVQKLAQENVSFITESVAEQQKPAQTEKAKSSRSTSGSAASSTGSATSGSSSSATKKSA